MSKFQSQLDRTPFWGNKITPELKYLQQIFNKKVAQVSLERPLYRELLKFLFSVLNAESQKSNNGNEYYEKLRDMAQNHNIQLCYLTMIYTGLLKLLTSALRAPAIKQEVIKEDLSEFLKFPAEFTNDFVGVSHGQRREIIEGCLLNASPKYPFMQNFNWRIDVSISTSSLSRTLESIILVQMQLSDGRIVSFEITLAAFHNLRFNVAMILKEMDDLLNRQMFKLTE